MLGITCTQHPPWAGHSWSLGEAGPSCSRGPSSSHVERHGARAFATPRMMSLGSFGERAPRLPGGDGKVSARCVPSSPRRDQETYRPGRAQEPSVKCRGQKKPPAQCLLSAGRGQRGQSPLRRRPAQGGTSPSLPAATDNSSARDCPWCDCLPHSRNLLGTLES